MKLILLAVLVTLALAQTSRYPGQLDSDSSLFVVSDNIQTSLNAAMAVTDTVAVVASSTGFVPNMIATICDASTNTGKCTAWEHMLVTAVAGNVLTVTRGFAGTTARAHTAGRIVNILIDSAHQASLKSAVIAIESALGPNIGNVGKLPYLNSASYAFGPIASGSGVSVPGGALINGTNVLTFATVPAGVNGSDTNHSLYFSGGTGGPQACLINGGSGTAGQTNGQITVNCTKAQSGAWSVQSANGGISEALWSLPASGGGIYLQCGTPITMYAGVYASVNLVIQGCGKSSMITLGTAFASTGNAFSLSASGLELEMYSVFLDGNRNAGVVINDGVSVVGTGDAVLPKLILRGSTFQNITPTGATVRLADAKSSEITGNVFTNISAHSMYVHQSTTGVPTNHTISNNKITYTIYSITGCTNTSPPVCSITTPGGFYPPGQNNAVVGTSIPAYNVQASIKPSGAGPPYSAFTLGSVAAAGASTGGSLIEGNFGIHLDGQMNCMIANNTLIGGGYDIEDSTQIQFIGNNSNTANDAALTLGGSIVGVQYVNVVNFYANQPFYEGIWFGGVGGGDNIVNPTIFNAGLGGQTGRKSGINIFATTHSTVQGGLIGYSGEYGLVIRAGAGAIRLTGTTFTNSTLGAWQISNAGGNVTALVFDVGSQLDPTPYSSISTMTWWSNGSRVYCSDCNATCTAGASTGQMCYYGNGAWSH